MNICWLVGRASGSASEVFIQREIEAAVSLGHGGIMAGVADGSMSRFPPGREKELALAVHCLDAAAWRRGLRALARCGLWQLRRSARLIRFASALAHELTPLTHIHAHFAHLPAVYGCGLAAIFGLPFSASVHARDAWVPWPAGIAALSQARRIICCSAAVQNRLLALRPEMAGRISLVPHGLLRSEIPLAAELTKEREPWLFAAGRWVEKKGFAVLLRAFAQVRKRLPHLRLCLAGDGPEADAIRSLSKKSGLASADTLIMPGWLSQGEIRGWLLRCALAVVPSIVAADGDRDGIPNILLEAMAAGAPVVASRVGGIPEVVTDNVTGLLVEPGDATALAEAICSALSRPAMARSWAMAGRARLERDFIAEDNAVRWVEALARSDPAAGKPW